MRALLIGALGLTLLGCSHSPSPQAAMTSCDDPGAECDGGAVTPPAKPAPSRPHPAATRTTSRLATTAQPSPAPAHASPATPAVASKVARTAADFGNAQASVADRRPVETESATSRTASREGQALARADVVESAPVGTDALVAVVMARPDVKALSELAGKTIAIDDRYAASNGSVRTAIVAAGAPAVQLSEGQATAINRLTNGEVPAAVVALVTPDAAETFPAIAGYRMFHVPLSPRAVKPAR